MNTRTTNILTADEFIAQGTTAGAIMSIAAVNPRHAEQLRTIARQVANRTGQTLQIPGELTTARQRRGDNDNRRDRKVA